MKLKKVLSPDGLSVLYKVPMELINNGIQQGNLIVENNKISLREFRAWCEKRHVKSKTKKCQVCGEDLPLYRYAKHPRKSDGLEPICLGCRYPKTTEKPQGSLALQKDSGESHSLFSPEYSPAPEKIALSIFSFEYGLTEEENIRLYTFIARREVTKFSLDKVDLLIDRKTAEWFLVGAFNFKRCPRCGKIKRFSEYYSNSKLWHGCQHWCKECAVTYEKGRQTDIRVKKQAKSELKSLLDKYPHLEEQIKKGVLTF